MFIRRKLFFFAPLAILAFAVFIFIGGEVVKLLWNWLMPALFDWRPLTFWQALGLLALCRILFGGFGGRGFRKRGFHARTSDRWKDMTPEQRDKFRDAMRDRWGYRPKGDLHDI